MRKVLSFVLVLALVLGSFSFAFGLTDIDDSANKDAIQLNNDLGIITGYPDGTFQGDKAVNRAEFAAMITRALGVPESALAGYATTSFKDVAGYGWAVPYLAFCESKGIMLGDGMGNAMPGRTISVNEAITMALRAIGYTENSALLVGTWPSNYVSLGQQKGLYTDLATATTIDRENAAQVIYNALTVNLVSVNADGQTSDVTPAKNMLTAYLKATETTGQAIANADYANANMNITDFIGAKGTKYTKSIDGSDKIVAFTSDYKALEGYLEKGAAVASDKFVVGDTKYSFDATINSNTTTFPSIVNTANSPVGGTTLAGVSFYDETSVKIWAKTSGNTITEILSVVTWDVTVNSNDAMVDSEDLKDIEDGELLGEAFVLDTSDNIKTNNFKLVGVTSLGDIDVDDVVYVYVDAVSGKIRMVAVGQDTVKGIVTERSVSATGYFMVGGEKYYLATTNNGETVRPSLGDEVELYLDAFGDVYDYDVITGTTDSYGMAYSYTSGSAFADAKVKIVTDAGDYKTFTFVSWSDLKGNLDKDDWNTVTSEGAAKLVSYGLNDSGLVAKATTAGVTATNAAYFKSSSVVNIASATGTLADKKMASDAVVFVYDVSGTTGEMYSIGSVDNLELNTTGGVIAYALNSLGTEVKAIVVKKALESADSGSYGVFYSEIEQADGSDTVYKLDGFVNGAAFSKISESDLVVSAGAIGLFDVTMSGDKVSALTAITATTGTTTPIKVANAQTVTKGGIDTENFVLTNNTGAMFTLEEGAVYYKAILNAAKDEVVTYEPATLGDVRSGNLFWVYDTKTGTKQNGVGTIVIFTDGASSAASF